MGSARRCTRTTASDTSYDHDHTRRRPHSSCASLTTSCTCVVAQERARRHTNCREQAESKSGVDTSPSTSAKSPESLGKPSASSPTTHSTPQRNPTMLRISSRPALHCVRLHSTQYRVLPPPPSLSTSNIFSHPRDTHRTRTIPLV
ncbi:hypothetical protein L226DRAFT_160872 [Lentinus tigrinus ALCF2SS1-7]